MDLVARRGEGRKIELAPAARELIQREISSRLAAIKHALVGGPFDTIGSTLLDILEQMRPEQAKAIELRAWYVDLTGWLTADSRSSANPTQMPAAARLGWELAASLIFGATMLEFFTPGGIPARLEEAEGATADAKSIDRLVAARRLISLNPRTSIACTSGFRTAWSLDAGTAA